MTDRPVVYTIREVADILKVSVRTVQRMIRRGDIRAVKIGGSVRIPKEALDEVLGSD